jgi:hypothetical protein
VTIKVIQRHPFSTGPVGLPPSRRPRARPPLPQTVYPGSLPPQQKVPGHLGHGALRHLHRQPNWHTRGNGHIARARIRHPDRTGERPATTRPADLSQTLQDGLRAPESPKEPSCRPPKRRDTTPASPAHQEARSHARLAHHMGPDAHTAQAVSAEPPHTLAALHVRKCIFTHRQQARTMHTRPHTHQLGVLICHPIPL